MGPRANASLLALAVTLTAWRAGSEAPPASGAPPTVAPAAPAAPAPSRPVAAIVDAVQALTRSIAGFGGQVSVAVLDVETGELLGAANEHKPLNPASNAKVLTAAAALATLRGTHRYETGLYGQIRGGSVASLVLRGHGDPSLSTKDLWDLVRALRDAGVRKVDGDILVDQRFFDDSHVPPAFEQQPNEWAYFRAPVSAVALNENTITMTVRPTAKGQPATVVFDPPGFVDVDGKVETGDDGHPAGVTLALAPSGQRLVAHVGGRIPESSRSQSFTRRVDDPSLLAGYALKALLVQAGITVAGDVKTGGEGAKTLIVSHRSRPLSELLYELGKQSDNFYAEMVMKTLGGEKRGRPARTDAGAEVVVKWLGEIGALEEGTVVKNGSGLFDANRVTASTFVKVLRAAWRDPALQSEFVAQLAIGGVDGTLHGRFRKEKARRSVRAKTGTLEGAAALTGYVLGPPGKGPYAFSIVVNGVAGKVSGTRVAIDKCVEAIARTRWQGG